MGVGLPAAAETSTPDGAEAALRSDLVQVRPGPVQVRPGAVQARPGPVQVRPLPSGDAKTAQGAQRLTELLRCHYAQVWRTLRRFGVDEPFADDAAQQVFMVLSSKLDQVQVGCERKFLLSSAVRIASNYRQTWRRRHEVVDERALANECDPLPTVEQLLDEKRLRQAFDELLERWPADIRTVFVLFELEGLSVPEISELTETKMGTVSSRLRRARALFQAGVKRLKARGSAGNQP